MKTTLKKVGVLFAVIMIILACIAVAVMFKVRSETAMMRPLPTGEIRDGVYAVFEKHVNMYLVKGRDGYIAIDAGQNKTDVETQLQKLKIDAGQIKAVFLTHTDIDHTGAIGLFKNARIFISKPEEQMINGKTPRFFYWVKNSLPVQYETLEDCRTIEISGIAVQGILTPGHTPGAMCYLVFGRDLFTGDTLSLKDGKAGLFNDFFNMDSETQKQALHKLKNTPGIQYIFSAHYGYAQNRPGCFENW